MRLDFAQKRVGARLRLAIGVPSVVRACVVAREILRHIRQDTARRATSGCTRNGLT